MRANSAPRGSAPSRPQKGRAPCENVEREFARRFLALLLAAYDPCSTADALDFPPVKPAEPAAERKARPRSLASRPAPFDGAVWDIRLRKAAAVRRAEAREAGGRVAAQRDCFAELTAKPAPDLGAVFLPEPALRPETPRYLANAAADSALEERSRKERSAPLGLADCAQRWQARIGRRDERRRAHAARMNAFRLKQGKAHREFLQAIGAYDRVSIVVNQ
jgi:hypothetical protein